MPHGTFIVEPRPAGMKEIPIWIWTAAKIIWWAGDSSPLNCLVCNVTSLGACLELNNWTPLPDEFALTFDTASYGAS